MTSDELHHLASRLVGVPWQEGGRFVDPEGGADCLGLALDWMRTLGFDVADPWQELERVWRDRDAAGRDAHDHAPRWGWEQADGPSLGAVAVCENGGHCAPYVGGGYVVHARRGVQSYLGQARKLPEDTRWYRPCRSPTPTSRSRSSTTCSASSTTRDD